MVAEVYKLKENSEDKLKALEMAIGQIEKSFGKGSVMKLGQNESVVDIEAISSGPIELMSSSAGSSSQITMSNLSLPNSEETA